MSQCDQGGTSQIDWIRFRSPNGTYKIDDTIDIRVFVGYDPPDHEGYDTDGSGGNDNPLHLLGHTKIKLKTGGESDGFADFLRNHDGGRWVDYRYTVRAGDNSSDLDYDSTRALYYVVTHSGLPHRVADGNGAHMPCYLPAPGGPGSLSAQADIGIDGIAPRVANVTVDPSDGYGYGETVEFDVNFDEIVVYSGAAPVLRLDLGGGETRSAGYASGNNTNRLTFAYEVQVGDDSADADYDGTMALTTAGNLTDHAGNDANRTLSASGSIGRPVPVRLGDIVGPSVLSVSSPSANGTYGAGSYVNVTILFDEDVQVTGTPLLELATGVGASRNATYASGNGSSILAFDYTVAQGDRAGDLDYTSAAALHLDGGTIRDALGNDADLALPEPGEEGSLGRSADILVKTAGPFVRHAASPDADGAYRTGRIVAIELNFTDPVTVDGSPRLELGTDPVRHALYAGGSGTDALEFWYTVQPGDTAAVLDYNDTASLAVPEGGSISAAQGGAVVDLELWRPGSPGSLSASRSIAIAGAPGALLSPATSAPALAYAELVGPYGVDVLEADNKTFALVGANDGDGLQLVRIRDGRTLEESASMSEGWQIGMPFLSGVNNVHAFEMNGVAHALAASRDDFGIQLVRINGSGAGTMSADGGVTYWSQSVPDARSVYDADTFEMDNKTYGILTVPPFDNVNVIRIYPNGTLEKNHTAGPGGSFGTLDSPRGIEAFELNGTAHAIAALSNGNGVQLIRIHPDGRLEGISRAGDSAAFPELIGARGVDVFEMDDKTYAIVAASGDDGVQLIRIHTDGTLEGVSWATDSAAFPELDGASNIDAFKLGGAAYAVVTAYDDDGVQLIRIHPDGRLEGVSSATDGSRFTELNGARGIAAFELGGAAYAAAVGYNNDGLQIIRITPTLATNVFISSADDTCGLGCQANVTVEFDGAVRVLGSAPSLSLLLDGRAVSAPYLSGNNTDMLVFNYTVRPGDLALGGIGYAGAAALATRGAITGIEGEGAYLALPAPGDPGSLAAKDPLVVDTRPAEALSASTPLPNGTYPAYYRIPITVAFDKPVDVLGPPPSLLLAFDGGARTADYVSGSGTRLLEFEYAVQPGDSALGGLDYAGANALAAGSPGGRIVDALWAPGEDADLALPDPGSMGSLGHMRGIAIDASTAAYARNATSPNADGAYGPGRAVYVEVRFSVPVDVAGVPSLALATDPPQSAAYHGGTGTNVLTFRYEVEQGDNAADLEYAGPAALSLGSGGASSIRDASDGTDAVVLLPPSGAEGSLGSSKNIIIDTKAPSVAGIASPGADGTYGTGRIVDIAVSFDERVDVAGAPALGLATDPPRNATYASGNGTAELTFAYAVQPGDAAADLDYAGRNALSLGAAAGAAIRDAAGNAANLMLPAPGPGGPLAGRSDIAVWGAKLPVLATAAPAAADTLLDFAGARYSVTVEAGNRTYAVATSYSPSAALLVRVHENGTLEEVHRLPDNAGRLLGGAIGVDAFKIGNRTFAVVAALNDDGVQLLEVHPGNESLTAVGILGNANDRELDGAIGVDAFKIGNRTFAVVAALWDDGVQLLEVHPGNGTLRPVDRIPNGGGLRLDGAGAVAAFEIGNRTYAAVAARDGNGVQVVRIHGNGTLDASPDHQIGDTGSLALASPLAIDAFEIGNRTYAAVAARGGDNGIQVVRIRDDGTPEASPDHRLVDTGGLRLVNPHGVAAFEMGGQMFAAVASTGDDGIQLVRFRDDGTPLPAGSASLAEFPALRDAYGVDVFAMGNHTYAMVTSSDGSSGEDVQLIRLSPASAENASASLRDGAYAAGRTINITVGFDAPVSVSGPSPSLLLDLGGREGAAEYLTGNGTAGLVFNYTVRQGDNAGGGLEYAGPAALVTRGAIEDAGARGSGAAAADLELPAPGERGSIGHGRTITIDTPPAVESVYSPDAGGAYAANATVDIAVAFTEAVDVTGAPILWLSTDPPRSAAYVDGSDGDAEIEFRYKVLAGDSADPLNYANRSALALNSGTITDAGGSAAATLLPPPDRRGLPTAAAGSIRIDGIAPRVTGVAEAHPTGAPYGEGDTVRIAVAFGEEVAMSGPPASPPPSLRLSLDGGATQTALFDRQADGGYTLAFNYTVLAGDSADPLGYDGRTALSAGGRTLADRAGNAAILELPPSDSAGSLRASGIIVDGDRDSTGGGTGGGGTGGGGTGGGGTGGGGTGGGETPGGTGGGETPGGSNGTDPGARNATSPVVVVGPDRIAGQGNFTGRGDEARITIDVSGLPGAGTAGGAVRFPTANATVVTASFASVSFPPGVEATSVPADGRLVLHVVNASVDADLPSNSSIRDALAYGGSGAVVLQRVVEVGSGDGRIEFTKPVRISLEGQAAGRAFYIDGGGANGTIVPIDMACAADDTDRVHRQLGGSGECRIGSVDRGGDLVVYTYHLTRFGTVASERGTPPPVYHTCSLRLGASGLAVNAMPGDYSGAVRQDVANAGSQEFDRVTLDATPWYMDPSSPRPGPNASALPASLTVTSADGRDGTYSQLPAAGAAMAQGLAGGLGEPLWLKINLTGHDQVNATRLVQHVEYTAECAGPPARQ